MTTLTKTQKKTRVYAKKVWCDDTMLHVQLTDERVISTPLKWFPTLAKATKEQRSHWELIGKGSGIHWEDIDEDLSVERLVNP